MSDFGPDLKIGTKKDFFHASGNFPIFNDILNRCCNGSVSSSARFFRNAGAIPSGPGPLDASKFFNAWSTSVSDRELTDTSLENSGMYEK